MPQIELMNEQYKTLLELLYLGNWMKSSHQTKLDKKITELEQAVYRYAAGEEQKKFVKFDEGNKSYYATAMFDFKMMASMDISVGIHSGKANRGEI